MKRLLTPLPVYTAPVFLDPTHRRWRLTLLFAGLLTISIPLAVAHLLPTQFRPVWPTAASMHQDPSFPREVINATPNGRFPVVGGEDSVLDRVDSVKRSNGKVYLADPFSDQVFRQATDDELDTIGKSHYVLERFGKMPPHQLALTFDDGPGPVTPKLLDVLSRNHVQATFFNIGENILGDPAVFQRTVREGHMIGNHTLTHINFDAQSNLRDREELILNDHFMRANGYATRLFRMPYGSEELQQLGYIDVDNSLDTNDWRYKPGQTVPLPDLDGQGYVVLMHDGGGDRAGTLDLVQRFITKARSQGYTFTTLLPLLPKDYVPQHVASAPADLVSWDAAWGILVLPVILMTTLFWFGVGSLSSISLIYLAMALLHERHYRKRYWEPGNPKRPFVSVLIPAHNEEKVIAKTLDALRLTNYPEYEVVAISNASTDKTLDVLRTYAQHWPRLRVLNEPKPGKVNALNTAIRQAWGEVIVMMDADTVFLPSTISYLTRHFRDPKVAAVAGHVKVGNRRNLITAWQALEYLSGICVTRMAEGLMGGIMIVPGACSAWRKSAVVEAGGLSDNTLAEDCDLTICLQRLGYKITQDNRAIALTEAPTTLTSLAKQRLRWMFGNIQVFHKHRNIVLRPRYGALGMLVLPYALLSILVPLLFTPLMYASAALSLLGGNWQSIVLFAIFVTVIHLVLSLTAVIMTKERLSHLLVVPLYRFIYEPLRMYLLYATMLKVLKGRATTWYSPKRTNTVVLPPV
jgi:cellulose synthase/poly-beta-1,6-N-acetylglucosamine synthase-like glycosyltransferase/peptidoglycan/xylan/chitin deacetylase (PgdA/CDA1 family)